MKFKTLSIFLFLFIFYGCTLTKQSSTIMAEWVGHPISSTIASWGPETRITSDGKGGKVYTWVQTSQTGAYYLYGVYQPPRQMQCSRNFYVDSRGIIYSWRWQGNCN